MTRLVILGGFLLALLPSLAPASQAHARVWLADRDPLVVKGTGFKAHERVVVTLVAGKQFVRTVKASAAGAISAGWTSGTAVKDGCVAIRIQAAGNRGTLAIYKFAGRECAQGPADPGP